MPSSTALSATAPACDLPFTAFHLVSVISHSCTSIGSMSDTGTSPHRGSTLTRQTVSYSLYVLSASSPDMSLSCASGSHQSALTRPRVGEPLSSACSDISSASLRSPARTPPATVSEHLR